MQCWACSSLMSAAIPAGIGVARGDRGPCPPQIFRTYSHLCFERRYHKENSVIHLNSNILPTPNIWAGHATACRGKLATLRAGCFYCWSLLCKITWQQMFTSSNDIRRFVACDSWTQTSWQVMYQDSGKWLLIAASRDVGYRWHWIPHLSHEGQRWQRCLFIGNFVIYQDRIETSCL